MIDFKIASNKEGLAKVAAKFILAQAKQAIQARGIFTIALSGGSTPRATFEAVLEQTNAKTLDWGSVHFFWSDERMVPPSHSDSNYRMALNSLLAPLEIPENNIHRIESELAPFDAAARYQSTVYDILGTPPIFDLVLLGMGSDGHTASLFPNTTALNATEAIVVANWVEQHDSWRITFTAELINEARQIAFLIAGENKAEMLRKVIEGNESPHTYPAKLINPSHGDLTWLLDEAAAQYLSRE